MISVIHPRVIEEIIPNISRDGKTYIRGLFGEPVNADLITVFVKSFNCSTEFIPVAMAMTSFANTDLILTDQVEQALLISRDNECNSSIATDLRVHNDIITNTSFDTDTTELKKYLRLQFADLGFKETVEKARFYMEVKDTSKPKKASVRFASIKRDPAVNAITSSTVDLEPIMNCLQDIKGRMDKMKRRGQPARTPTPPSRSTSLAPPQSPNSQRGRSSPRPRNDNAGYQRDPFEDQQSERFDDAPPPSYPASPQPRRFQTPPVK